MATQGGWTRLVVWLGVLRYTVTLTCYMCPRTDGRTLAEANLECLRLGWELSCSPEQDRCYSTNYPASIEVMKGCTTSRSCVENTACCEGDYCNADPQQSKTGVEQPCSDHGDCIQADDVMTCARRQPTDPSKWCLCTDDSYQDGFICQRKSFPDELCYVTSNCYDVNTQCVSGRCRCSEGLFSNNTLCSLQMSLGEPCLQHKECEGSNTRCTGMFCACAFGYIVTNGTEECSGIPLPATWNYWTVLLMLGNIGLNVVRLP